MIQTCFMQAPFMNKFLEILFQKIYEQILADWIRVVSSVQCSGSHEQKRLYLRCAHNTFHVNVRRLKQSRFEILSIKIPHL